jgi:hypothetical protein
VEVVSQILEHLVSKFELCRTVGVVKSSVWVHVNFDLKWYQNFFGICSFFEEFAMATFLGKINISC